MKNLPAKEGDTRDCRSNHWVEKIPWRRKWQLTPVFLPGKIPWHSLAWPATAYGDRKRLSRVLVRWMKLEPIMQSEVSQKDKDQYSILMNIHGI